MPRAFLLLLYDVLMVSLAIEDYKCRKIRNSYVQIILLMAVISVVVMPEISVSSRIAGMIAASVPMAGIAMIKPGSFGGGDVKLVFASGAFLGVELVVKGTVTAILLAGVYCIWMVCIKRACRNVQFALGPFLSMGYVMSAFALF